MTDTRHALEEAFKVIHPAPCDPRYPDDDEDFAWCKIFDRFRRFLDAEAWTDAALMLVPENHRIVTLTEHVDRGGWYVKLAVHSPHKALPAVEASTLALAIAQAALRAQEGGDVHQTLA